jgi:hypothetical protein
MSDDAADTSVVCHRCRHVVPAGTRFCTVCGAMLSSSQMRASGLRELTDSGFRSLAKSFVQRLDAFPTREVARRDLLAAEGRAFVGEFLRWEEGGGPGTSSARLARLQAFSDWHARVAAHLRG